MVYRSDYWSGFEVGPPESYFGEAAWQTSNRITHLISIACRSLSLLPVAEYPRSGGTWVGEMLADYFQVPFPKYNRLPVACAAVIHTHLWYSARLPKAVFVARDGRDLAVSSYFHTLKYNERLLALKRHRHRHLSLYPSLRGATTELDDCRERLPQFIRDWWSKPIGCRYNWGEYTSAWTTNASNVIVTSYELLRADCIGEMARVVELLTNKSADVRRLNRTVDKFSFAEQTGRHPGQMDHFSNKRSGQVGDWRNYFTREAAVEFQSLAGQVLVQRGYEPDGSWVSRCPDFV